MADMVWGFGPNQKIVKLAPGDALWHKISDWPGLDPGGRPTGGMFKSVTSADADGSPFEIAFNSSVAPTVGWTVSGSGQVLNVPLQVYNTWFKMTVTTDVLEAAVFY